jgi:hypothetical protein
MATATPKIPHPRIGTLGEKTLHAQLKEWYAEPGDRLERQVDGFLIDLVRGDLLIEIQTAGFSALKRKLRILTETRPVRLVHPLARDKWIVRVKSDGETLISRRKSPLHCGPLYLFKELVRFPELIHNPRFSVEVLFVEVEEIRCDDGRGSRWRKGWSIADRRLVRVADRLLFEEADDFARLLPEELPGIFSTRDLAAASGRPRWLVQKMAFCLRCMGVVEVVGKEGNAFLYSRALANGASRR